MKIRYFYLILMTIFSIQVSAAPATNYLSKPTGKYGVGFQEFHWINTNLCPDPNYNGRNDKDFSAFNKNYCHETIARIYYPTPSEIHLSSNYYFPLVKSAQEELRRALVVPKKQIDQLSEIKTYSEENAPILSSMSFPVILFSPGFGVQSEMYENFIEELVSHGYIVIGINSPFISGELALPNNHIVKYLHKYEDESGKYDQELLQITLADFLFVFDQIHQLHESSSIFKAMDLKNIGALGHSIGGNVVAKTIHAHTNWFQAAGALDIGYDLSEESYKKFTVPFINLISSKIKDRKPAPVFEMAENEFVVGISPDEQNRNYSYHMNFTDQSTLQYLPAYQTLMWWLVKVFHQEDQLPIGKGDGWEITHSINTYVVQFFDTFMKHEPNPAFSECTKLSDKSFIKCGPGIF